MLVYDFPVGAKCTSLLYKHQKINIEQAKRMMCFCICPGPAFLITALGSIMLGNNVSGIILYISQIISSLLIGIILGIHARINNRCQNSSENNNKNAEPVISCLIGSASDGAYSIIEMTALILIFSLFENILSTSVKSFFESIMNNGTGYGRELSVVIPIIMEVTGGCQSVKDASLPLWMFSLCVGFGGLCVHFQIFSVIRNIPLSRKRYIVFRMINALLSAVVTKVICIFYDPVITTMTVGGGDTAYFSAKTVTGSIAMLIMSVIFVITMHRDRTLKLR